MSNNLRYNPARSIREHYNRFMELVSLTERLPNWRNKHTQYEKASIFFRMVKRPWQENFLKAGKSLVDHPAEEICDYFDQLETLEGIEPKNHDKKTKSSQPKHNNQNNKGDQAPKQKKFCQCCFGNNRKLFKNHNTSECWYLRKDNQRARGERGEPRYRRDKPGKRKFTRPDENTEKLYAAIRDLTDVYTVR